MMEISPQIARKIIEIVGGMGTPPEYGYQYFTVGLDYYLNTLEEEYLKTYIKNGGSSFKMIIGHYGEGKTHFLYCLRERAWKYNYLSSYIILTPEETPFYRIEQIYKAIVKNMVYPLRADELLTGYEYGIDAVIKVWFYQKYQEFKQNGSGDSINKELKNYALTLGPYDSTSFKNAIMSAFLNLAENNKENFETIIQWLKGENPDRSLMRDFKIFEEIDKSNAFEMIRSLVQWIVQINYSGLIVLMDEAEQTPSMSSKQKNILLNNLRELIDECGHTNFKNTMFFYAVPDESFLDGKTHVYEAVRQRLSTPFEAKFNPTGVKIDLDNMNTGNPEQLMRDIGTKLAQIYEKAYNIQFDTKILKETIINIAKAVYERKFMTGYKRLFVQSIVRAFHYIRVTGKGISSNEAINFVDRTFDDIQKKITKQPKEPIIVEYENPEDENAGDN